MSTIIDLRLTIIAFLILRLAQASVISLNQPKFCSNASWNPNATTLVDNNTIGHYPYTFFVNTHNTLFVARQDNGQILIWRNGSVNPTRTILANLSTPESLFVSSDEEIFVENGSPYNRVERWTSTGAQLPSPMSTCSPCRGLFVDSNDQLYCSQFNAHQVLRSSLQNLASPTMIVAGTGGQGSTANTLNSPWGIFVTNNFDLYVADYRNNRIQLFQSGELQGRTVAGRGSNETTITLRLPTGVMLDADGYLFIVDNFNHRIIGSDRWGFRCLVGCSGVSGRAGDRLNYPHTMNFDSDGNLFVLDVNNHRVQKFFVAKNSCIVSDPSRLTSTTITAVLSSTPSSNIHPRPSTVRSINQPKLCPEASWNPDGTTVANNNTIGSYPHAMFVNTLNTLFVANSQNGQILFWPNASANPPTAIFANLVSPRSLFVTTDEEIFADNSSPYNRVERWTSNGTQLPSPMSVSSQCHGLFIDSNNNLYCSEHTTHQVSRNSLQNPRVIVAGTGCSGSNELRLNSPWGIFVTTNFDLYVADSANNRIQFFRSGELQGRTVAGNGSNQTAITLRQPTGVVLDADGYLFIVDNFNHRIIGSDRWGFRCVVGCSGGGSSAASWLNFPVAMNFDSDGNLFVLDVNNHRVQKFLLATNSCDISTSMSSVSIILIPKSSNVSSPLQFRRNEDFFISSRIELNCDEFFHLQMQWTISNGSSSVVVDESVVSLTTSELFVPSRTLPFGVYQLTLTMTLNVSSNVTRSSESTFVQINPSGIATNLLPLGTSMITRGAQQDLYLNPGLNSLDLDEVQLDASDWTYEYYCRIYGVSNFPNIQGHLIPVDDSSRQDPSNPQCLNNRTVDGSSVSWRYAGVSGSLKSSLIIVGGSFLSNRTYQLMLEMTNQRNPSRRATSYLLLRVESTFPQLIAIDCVTSAMVIPNSQYRLINPTTQLSLVARCLDNCSSQKPNISWNIYQGENNSSNNVTRWTPFNQTNLGYFFGVRSTLFTADQQLFVSNPSISLWRFEVVYSLPSSTSVSASDFMINPRPENGSCSISPQNGTTLTLFSVSCLSWFDEDGIKDYSLFVWSNDDPSRRSMVGFSSVAEFEVYLPISEDLRLLIVIRDRRDCLTEWKNRPLVIVKAETDAFDDLLQSNGRVSSLNPFVHILSIPNQNHVGQILSSLSEQLNRVDEENLQRAISNGGVPAVTISVSSLHAQPSLNVSSSSSLNLSASEEFERELNRQANLREYLIPYLMNLPVTSWNTIEIQSTTLVQLTQSTHQLSRSFLTLASTRCLRLTSVLFAMARRISREDLQMSSNQLVRCSSNLLTAVNGPLQQRTTVLDSDRIASSSSETRNLFEQTQLASRVRREMNELIFLLTRSLIIHLNVGQHFQVNSSAVFMSLETLSNKQMSMVGNAFLRLPSTLNISLNDTSNPSLRSTLEPLPFVGRSSISTMNFSRSISLSLVDEEGDEIPVRTPVDQPVELIIPRDPSFRLPLMSLHNVTSKTNDSLSYHLFNLHSVDLNQTSSSSFALHLEIHPLSVNVSYLMIYRFDASPVLNNSFSQIDGWSLVCPSMNESVHTHFFGNNQTFGHHSLIFGLRQLNSTDACSIPPTIPRIPNERSYFTSNYELRLYTSSCFYFDEKSEEWKTDGLIVGPLSNHFQTQCFSTRI